MVLKLDPRIPLVWRSPSALQLGVDPVIVTLEDVTSHQERMLSALEVGVSGPGLAMLAGARATERDALLEIVAPALASGSAEPSARVAVSGSGPVAEAIIEMLAGSGIPVTAAAGVADLLDCDAAFAVAVADHVLPPDVHSAWLRRDIPHLPVVVTDGGAIVGPVVEPGSGPCLLCLERHRRDADPAWPAIATQLLGRRSRAAHPALVAEASALAVRTLRGRLAHGAGAAQSVRIDSATGTRTTRSWDVHPQCGCAGLGDIREEAAG